LTSTDCRFISCNRQVRKLLQLK